MGNLTRIFKDKKILVPILFGIILLVGLGGNSLNIVKGPEGINALNYGVDLGGNIAKASSLDPLPQNFQWINNQPSVMILKHIQDQAPPVLGNTMFTYDTTWAYGHDSGTVRSEVQRPLIVDDPTGLNAGGKTLEYYKYVQTSQGVEIHKVTVELVPVDFVIQISAGPYAPTQGCLYTWENKKLWYALDSVTWLNSYATSPPLDPNPLTNSSVKYLSSNYRGAFPIIAWIGEYHDLTWTDSGGRSQSATPDPNAISKCQLDPSLQGRYIDLYTEPSKTYDLMLSANTIQDETTLKNALTPDKYPDPSFSSTVYFPITLTQFGGYIKPTGILGSYTSYEKWFPSVYYRLRVVYAVYGEFVYLWSQSNASQMGYTSNTWQARQWTEITATDPLTGVLQGIGSWFSNPWNVTGLGLYGAFLLFGCVGIIAFFYLGKKKRRRS